MVIKSKKIFSRRRRQIYLPVNTVFLAIAIILLLLVLFWGESILR
jgi:hypothetical protein